MQVRAFEMYIPLNKNFIRIIWYHKICPKVGWTLVHGLIDTLTRTKRETLDVVAK